MSDDHRFWEELHRDLSRIITSMRPHAPAEWREDAVQNTVIRIMGLLEAEKKQKADISRAYARRVAFCTMANMWNRRQEDLLEEEDIAAIPSLDPDPETHVVNLELGRLIEKNLARLSRDRRLAVQLCILQGHSVPEAATILGFSRKKTENLVNRGRLQLRQWLAEEWSRHSPRLDRTMSESTIWDCYQGRESRTAAESKNGSGSSCQGERHDFHR